MTGEYLSPEEAETIVLPRFNLRARQRKLDELTAGLVEGIPEYADIHIKNRTGLVILAQYCQTMDATSGATEEIQKLNETLETHNQEMGEWRRYINTSVPDPEAQPELPLEIEGL